MSISGWKVSVPTGLDTALEGLTRAVLKRQPKDIYTFAAEYFENLLQNRLSEDPNDPAHNAGLSPSSTHDSESKTGGNGELQVGDSSSEREKKTSLVSHERLPEEPESNDTSYGVEATAVRTLAASTGTVAILGTTAQTAEKSKSQTDLTEDSTKDIDISIQDDNKEEVKSPESNNQNKRQSKADDNSTTVSDIVIENDERATSSSLSDSNKEEINKLKERTESTVEQPIENHVKPDATTSHENSIESHTNSLDSDNVTHEPSVKQTTTALVENIKSTDDESETSLLPNGEINNLSIDKDDVCSSEDNLDDEEERPATVVEIEKNINNKENESKSRSSISENSGSDDTKGMTDDISSEQLKTNSFSDTTLSESFNAELDSIKHSPEGKEEINIDDDDAIVIESAETVPEKENETKDGTKPLELTVVMPKFDSETKSSDDEEQKTETKEDEIKKETFKEVSEIPSKSANKEVKTENEVVKSPPLNTLENILSEEECKQVLKSIEMPESKKKLSELPLSDQKDEKPKTPKPDVIEEKIEPTIIKKDQAKPNTEKTEVKEEIIIPETVKRVESILPPGKNEEKLDNKTEVDESKLAEAATTIQATFRGYQTRQNIQKKDPEKEDILVQIEKEIEVKDTEDKDKLDSAATTIQANFRGFQTRQNLQKKEDDKEDKTQVDSVDTDNEKEKLEQAATTIQASFRGYQTRQNIQKQEENQDEKPKDTNKNVEEKNVEVTEKPIESNKNVEETINLNDDKEALESAATTIQATFRGYQARQNIEKDKATSKNSEESIVEEITIDPVTSVSIKDKTEKLTDEISKDAFTEKEIDSTKSEIKDLESEAQDKLSSAATTIQSNFRGFKTRKNLGKKSVTICEDNLEDDDVEDEEKIKAATKIQANFRGFQTRKKLDGKHTDEDDEEIILPEPPSLTPELIESVKEEVDEICKQAVETTENMIKNGTDILFRAQLGSAVSNKNYEESESEIADSENESITTTANRAVQSIVEEAEHIAEERLNSAATRIQASFRGFQVRKNVDKPEETDGIPDFPPSTDEDYLFGTPVLDDDLPLPDFEALESSYSEEVATEPIDVLPPPLENLVIPESEEVSEASTEINDDDLRYLQRRQECDELKKTPELETSSEGESSLSSAATKIQAGVRGYLTRKHIQTGQGGTASTSGPSIASSDQSLGDLMLSKDEDGPVKSMISTEEETEICRHLSTPEKNEPRIISPIGSNKLNKKRMSLDSRLVVHPPSKNARPMRAMSVSSPRDDVTNEEVWQTLQDELTNAATRIQSNYRGYRARKQLTRGDAVQMATTSSSATGTPTPTNTSFEGVNNRTNGNVDRTSGEYHDIIALTPPTSLTTLGEKKEGETGELKEKDGESEKKQSVEGVKPTGELTAPASEEESKMVKRRHADDKKEEEDDEEKAAAKIQAGFRGYKVRKEMKPEDDKSSNKSNTTQSADNSKNKSTDSARNSRDAENEAAAKIQAGFRGMKTRQELKSKQNSSK